MDSSYVGLDENSTVLRALLPIYHHHNTYFDSLLFRPTCLNSIPIPTEGEEDNMASGISGTFHWPTASSQLYAKIPFPEAGLRTKPSSMSSNIPSFANSFPNMDFLASAATPLKISDQIDSSSSPESSSPKGMFAMDADSTPTDSSGGLQTSSPFSAPFEMQSNFPSTTGSLFDDECITGPMDNTSVVPIDASSSELAANLSDSPSSTPGKQDSSSLLNIEDTDSDRFKCQNQNGKRRKMQKKRVVLVPIIDGKQKGDTPPSDQWAWRKYGQKPIKGSPYPRGYYRCSSSKGCSARKQVERSSTDPNMLVVTYTSDHDHPCPANKSSKVASIAPPAPLPAHEQETEEKYQEEEQVDEKKVITTAVNAAHADSVLSRENLFSSIINSPQAMQEQVVSPLESLQESEENCFNFQRIDADLCFLSGTISGNEEDHEVFDDLGELPELATIFSKGYLEESFLMQNGNGYGNNYNFLR